MATYIYRREASTGARDLAEALGATRYRGRNYPLERKVRPGDVVIAWGERVPAIQDVHILNGAPILGKFEDVVKLKAAGVRTIDVSRTQPMAPPPGPPPVDPAIALFESLQEQMEDFGNLFEAPRETLRTRPFQDGLAGILTQITNLSATLRVPPPVATPVLAPDWLPRKNDHVGGLDLLTPPTTPDFWAKKENIVKEIRVHSFKGRSIRAGVKAPRDGFSKAQGNLHPWVRSWDGGWRMKYDGETARQRHRDIAHAAVAALGLDFGAVDVAELADGTVMVLEVNRAPGLSDGTADVYATAIQRWMQENNIGR